MSARLTGLCRYYGQLHLHFIYVSLLPPVAAAEEREGTGHFRNGFSVDRIRGDAGARTPLDKRAAARDTFDHAAQTQDAPGAKDARVE